MYELIKNMLMSAQYDLYETPDPANTGETRNEGVPISNQ